MKTNPSDDDRAVSIAITHSMTIGITAILLTMLLMGAGSLLDSQEQHVAEAEFGEIGPDLAAQVESLDSLNETGTNVSATASPEYPGQVGGSTWQVEFAAGEDQIIVPDPNYDAVLNITSQGAIDRTIQYPINNETQLETGNGVYPNSIELCLEDGTIYITGCP